MLKDQFLLDPEVIYLNHGSYGACPRPVFEAYQRWQRELERQPVQFLGVELDEKLYQSRQKLGEYLNAQPKDIVYVPNATHGVNIVARSLLFQPGDEILSTNHEYGACNYIWDFISQKTGAKYIEQRIEIPIASKDELIELLWRGVTPRTKVIFISHITSPTSISFPVEAICKLAREEGILTIVDGAHAPGQCVVNLEQIQADFYTANCHKWMLSPKGAGFIYARPDAQNLIEPLIVSWGYESRSSTPKESKFIDLLQWTGTKDPAAALTVPIAIKFMQENQWENVQRYSHSILKEALKKVSILTGIEPIYHLDTDIYHQMGTVQLPKIKDFTGFKLRLNNEYKIEIPCIEWANRQFLRISVQGYNSEDDINILIMALSRLLPEFSE